MSNGVFPSEFAKNMAIKVGLYPPESVMKIKDKNERNNWIKRMVQLKEFQQLSMYGSFEDALVVYIGELLDEPKLDVLRVIHKNTAPWARGIIAENLLDATNASFDSKAATDSAKVLLESLDNNLTEADLELINKILKKGEK